MNCKIKKIKCEMESLLKGFFYLYKKVQIKFSNTQKSYYSYQVPSTTLSEIRKCIAFNPTKVYNIRTLKFYGEIRFAAPKS